MARSFDGGASTVPGDIRGPVTRVIVVGAGMAGLATANALAQADIEVTVLEARDRLGGRTYTLDLDGAPVDLGASWIHTPIGNPMTALAEELGVERRPWHLLDLAVGWDPGSGRIEPDEWQRHLGQLDRFYDALPGLRRELGDEASARAGIDRFVGSTGLEPGEAARLRSLLLRMVEGDASGSAGEVPLIYHPTAGLAYDGDERGDVPVGGYRRIVEGLAAGLDIRTGTPVASIEVTATDVVVRAGDGTEHVGSHVVLTAPLGVLKSDAIAFDPPLPADRRSAIARLGFGRFDKLALRFERPFWSEAGMPHVLPVPSSGSAPFVGLFGLDSAAGEPVLVAFAFGSDHRSVAEGTVSEAVARMLSSLERMLGGPVPAPVATARSEWWRDPYARGAYSFIRIGSTPADLELLGQPLGGRLLFAGEATSHARVGYADGALSTGIREAKRLLGRASVELGHLGA
jgi:polyamine oxidase